MGEVVNMFKERAKPAAQPAAQETPKRQPGPTLIANASMLGAAGGEGLEHLRQMEEQGAAALVLSALLFYAHQGQDQGQRARRAVLAMQEVIKRGADPTAS